MVGTDKTKLKQKERRCLQFVGVRITTTIQDSNFSEKLSECSTFKIALVHDTFHSNCSRKNNFYCSVKSEKYTVGSALD